MGEYMLGHVNLDLELEGHLNFRLRCEAMLGGR